MDNDWRREDPSLEIMIVNRCDLSHFRHIRSVVLSTDKLFAEAVYMSCDRAEDRHSRTRQLTAVGTSQGAEVRFRACPCCCKDCWS